MFPYLFSSALYPNVPGTPRSFSREAAADAVAPIETRLEHLELACAGMWDLLKNKLGCTDEELIAAITAADARDGVMDGRAANPQICPHCGRKVLSRQAPKCSWCGQALKSGPF